MSATETLQAARQRAGEARQRLASVRDRARRGEALEPLALVVAAADAELAEQPLTTLEAEAAAEQEAEAEARRQAAMERYRLDEAAAVERFREALQGLRSALVEVGAATREHARIVAIARHEAGLKHWPEITSGRWIAAQLAAMRGEPVNTTGLYPPPNARSFR